jgi:hypothetical protein
MPINKGFIGWVGASHVGVSDFKKLITIFPKLKEPGKEAGGTMGQEFILAKKILNPIKW